MSGQPLRVLSAEDVARALPMRDAIDGMLEAYTRLSLGQADVPLRARVSVPEHDGLALFMPAYVTGSADLAVKVVSVYPRNPQRGAPVVYATVLVLDAASGRPLAVIEGSSLTAIRTGAGGGASAELLARPDARVVAVLGSGTQARTGLEAVCTVRAVDEVRVYSPNAAHCEAFAAAMAGRGPIPRAVRAVADSAEAVRDADIVYCATTAATPVFDGRLLKPGAHVIGVGSYTPAMQEVDAVTVQRARVVVDARASVLAEAGDLLIPIADGTISADHIHAELGEIAAGQRSGRRDAQEITFFKSVGVAVQDAVAARIALHNADRLGLGTRVTL